MHVRLQGKKVILRDLTLADVERIHYWNHVAEDREHQKWNGPYAPVEPKTLTEVQAQFAEELQVVGTDETRSRLVIEADGHLIGTVGRYWIDQRTHWAEIGLVIFDSRYWSGGYGSDAFPMWTDYLFTHMDTVRLGIGTWSGNERMIRLAAKCGMIEECRVRKARIVQGEYYDAIKMGILREEWEAWKIANQWGLNDTFEHRQTHSNI